MKTERWISVNEKLPEEGVIVNVKLGSRRIVEPLKRQGKLWFLADGSMYVYYTPTHWQPIFEPTKEIKQ